jgi:uncharacterized protein
MTPQEESMLNDLIGRVEQTQLTEKDPEAEQLLVQSLGRNPNALYILAQTVLVQKYALENATAQINQLRQQSQALQQPAHATSFLGSLLGRRDPVPPPPPPQAPPPPPGYGAPPAAPYAQPWTPVPAYGAPPPPPGGGSSFLRTAATTAAGVAAGALAFEGVESLLHGFGHPAGFGGGGYFGGSAPEEIVTNNYYDDSGRGSGDEHHERVDNSSFGDTNNDAANLQQASDDLKDDGTDQDDLSLDDTSYDDTSYDDGSSSSSDDLA